MEFSIRYVFRCLSTREGEHVHSVVHLIAPSRRGHGMQENGTLAGTTLLFFKYYKSVKEPIRISIYGRLKFHVSIENRALETTVLDYLPEWTRQLDPANPYANRETLRSTIAQ